jgi:hypothetical protein
MVLRCFRIAGLVPALVLFLIAAANASSPQAASDTCRALTAPRGQSFLSVPSTYDFLGSLDQNSCASISEEAFDELTDAAQFNFPSYLLLKGRLVGSWTPDDDNILKEYVQNYQSVQDLDVNALLPLIDVAFYPCKGDARCVGERVGAWLGGLKPAGLANCLFGMAGRCSKDEIDIQFPFLNDASLSSSDDAKGMFAQRAAFICNRYRDCRR